MIIGPDLPDTGRPQRGDRHRAGIVRVVLVHIPAAGSRTRALAGMGQVYRATVGRASADNVRPATVRRES